MTVAAIAVLAACQTVPQGSGFSDKQVAALTEAEFKLVGENDELGLAERVLFAADQSDFFPDSAGTIDRLAAKRTRVGIVGAKVEGRTDSTGSSAHNQQLSERGAAAVKAQFAIAGPPAANIRAVGRGETQPIAGNDTPDGRPQNRRVVIIVTPDDAN